MASRSKFGSSFIGYDKEHVDSYMESMYESNVIRLDELRRSINDIRNERDRLSMDLDGKQKQAEEYKKSRKYLEFSLKRAESAAKLISLSAENEKSELDEVCKAKLDEYDKEIERLDGEIKNKQEQLSFLARRASMRKQSKSTEADEPAMAREDAQRKSIVDKHEGSRRIGGSSFWDDDAAEESGFKETGSSRGLRSETRRNENNIKEDSGNSKGNFPSSPALSADISQVRNKYLVGKIAGEDLIARDGSIIAPQNSVITVEVVRRAQEEGKLAELIINMILPGMER